METSFNAPPVPPSTAAPAPVTATGSPYSYQNTSALRQSIIVSGGTVTTIEYSRDGVTYYVAGVAAGMFTLNPGDRLRITYAVAPTITAINL